MATETTAWYELVYSMHQARDTMTL